MRSAKEIYSEKEIRMFSDLGYDWAFIDTYFNNPIEPVSLYKMAVHFTFITNKQGPAVEALRRSAKALDDSKPYRKTKEFDDLIDY